MWGWGVVCVGWRGEGGGVGAGGCVEIWVGARGGGPAFFFFFFFFLSGHMIMTTFSLSERSTLTVQTSEASHIDMNNSRVCVSPDV